MAISTVTFKNSVQPQQDSLTSNHRSKIVSRIAREILFALPFIVIGYSIFTLTYRHAIVCTGSENGPFTTSCWPAIDSHFSPPGIKCANDICEKLLQTPPTFKSFCELDLNRLNEEGLFGTCKLVENAFFPIKSLVLTAAAWLGLRAIIGGIKDVSVPSQTHNRSIRLDTFKPICCKKFI